jgi:hypothetical protein
VLLARGHDRHGHYTICPKPPTAGIAEGLAAQAEFSARWRRFRLGK